MTEFEAIFTWGAVWCYGIGFLVFLYAIVYGKEMKLKWAAWLLYAGFALHNISIVIRWYVTGHAPVMRAYENSMLGGWFIMTLYLLVRRWNKKMELIGVVIAPILVLLIGNGIFSSPYPEPLSPPFKSNWLIFHVVFAMLAYGVFCMAAAFGVGYILKERAMKSEALTSRYHFLPTLEVLNDLILKTVIFGFLALTVEIGAGSIWAYGLWGRYWGWDPVETWSLITWLIYGIDIHLATTLGWRGKRMAWLSIFSLISLFIAYGGIGYIASVHTPIL